MGRSRTTRPQVIAVLKLPEEDVPLFMVHANAIAGAMDGNSWFPDAGPLIASLRVALRALADAQTATLNRKDAASDRDKKRNDVNRILKEACALVQRVADANPEHAASIIESAAMSVKKPRVVPPRIFAAHDGPVSGSAKVVAPRAGDRAVYEFAHSIDGKKTWIVHAGQRKSTLVIDGLTPGSTVWFRYRAATDAMGDWSDPISLIIR